MKVNFMTGRKRIRLYAAGLAGVISLSGQSAWATYGGAVQLACNRSPVVARTTSTVALTPQCDTVMQTVYQTVMVPEQVTVMQTQYKTAMKQESYTVLKPVQETSFVTRRHTVQKPVYETANIQRRYTVMKPAPMKDSVATSDRGDMRDKPQTPWPLVQPEE